MEQADMPLSKSGAFGRVGSTPTKATLFGGTWFGKIIEKKKKRFGEK